MTQPDTDNNPLTSAKAARDQLDDALAVARPFAGGEIRTLITLLQNALADHDARRGAPAPPVVVS